MGSVSAAVHSQCNSVDNTPGLGMECEVTVVNNIDLSTGVTSSTMTIRECHGAANTAPSTCTGPTVINSSSLINTVSQCNSSMNGGGGSLHCSISIVNNITGSATAVAATINQCNGSLTTGTFRACSPDGSATSGAAINQCNNSDNGGGSSLTCSVTPGSTTSAALPVNIDQCNYSANGGGSLIVCSVSMTNNIIPATVVVPPVEEEETPPTEGEEEGEVTATEGEEEGDVTATVVSDTAVPPTSVPLSWLFPGATRDSVTQPDRLAWTGVELTALLPATLITSLGALLVIFARVAPRFATWRR